MRQIKIFCIHPYCKDVVSTLEYMQATFLKDRYQFVWDPISPDYLVATEHVYSSYNYRTLFNKLFNKAKIVLFFSREAVSPDFNLFDYAYGFDYGLKNGDRFVRLPGPIELNPEFVKDKFNTIQTEDEALEELKSKEGFCNFLYSNPHAHPNRDKLFYVLSEYKRVDSLGRHLNNVGNDARGYIGHELDSIALKSRYKFSISAENASYRGYTSEKIITSLNAHTIPIYFGDPDVVDNFNPDCFINCANYNNINEVVEAVKEIDNDDELWCKMICAPWQTISQVERARKRVEDYECSLSSIFNASISEVKRRPQGTFVDGYVNQVVTSRLSRTNLIRRALNKFLSYFK